MEIYLISISAAIHKIPIKTFFKPNVEFYDQI